jgi:hypothetical protein
MISNVLLSHKLDINTCLASHDIILDVFSSSIGKVLTSYRILMIDIEPETEPKKDAKYAPFQMLKKNY